MPFIRHNMQLWKHYSYMQGFTLPSFWLLVVHKKNEQRKNWRLYYVWLSNINVKLRTMHFSCHLYMINKFKCSELQHLDMLYNKMLQVCLVCSIPLLLGRTYMMKYPSFTALLFNLQVLKHRWWKGLGIWYMYIMAIIKL